MGNLDTPNPWVLVDNQLCNFGAGWVNTTRSILILNVDVANRPTADSSATIPGHLRH